MNADGHDNLAYSYAYAGRLDEAIAEHRTVLRLARELWRTARMIGEALLQKGDPEAALAEIRAGTLEEPRVSSGCRWRITRSVGKSESDAALAS